MLLTNLYFVPLASPRPVGNQLTFKFGKTTKNIHEEIVGWALLPRKFSKDYADISAFEIAL